VLDETPRAERPVDTTYSPRRPGAAAFLALTKRRAAAPVRPLGYKRRRSWKVAADKKLAGAAKTSITKEVREWLRQSQLKLP